MVGEDIKKSLIQAVLSCQIYETEQAAQDALAAGVHPYDVIRGFSEGMREIGRLWNEMEIYMPEVMAAADAYYAGLKIVKAKIPSGSGGDFLATAVFGTIYGDIHSVGKDVVVPVFEAENFHVIDLGVDVSARQFIEAVREYKADIVGLGTYMSETFMHVGDVISELVEAGIRDDILVVCGGPAADSGMAKRMGADDAFTDAWVAVEKVKEMVRRGG